MKTIGLIGGMSWESSIEYYRMINETIRKKFPDFQVVGLKEFRNLGRSDQASRFSCHIRTIYQRYESKGYESSINY